MPHPRISSLTCLASITALLAVAGCKGLFPAHAPEVASTSNASPSKNVADAVPHPLRVLDAPAHDVALFLKQNCLECHNARTAEGDLVLEKFRDASSIRKDRKVWAKVLTLVNGGSMPPDEAENHPTDAQRAAFVNAAKKVLDYYDPARPDPGRITLRRLNRIEYDNSVSDLTQTKLFPSKEFPPDDISGGYDNNADGLTLSPLLTERYLLAADAILQQLLPEDGRYPQVSRMDTWPVPAGSFVQNGEGRNLIRHLLPGIKVSLQSAKTTVKTEGDYIFKTVAYRRKGAGLGTPIMEQLIDGQVVNTVSVEANSFEVAEVYSSPPVYLKPGPHLMEVRWPLAEGQKTPTLEEIGAQGTSGKGEEPPGLYHRWSEFYGPRTVHAEILAHRPDLSPRDGAKEVITRLASKAFRRPATEAEVDRLMTFYDTAPGVQALDVSYADAGTPAALTWYRAMRTPLQAILVSPQFLFRIEEDPQPEAPGPHPITDYQLASRLSYFLWSSPPDDELLTLAAKNELHDRLEEQAYRMLKDQRADALTNSFAAQWLHLRMLDKITPDRDRFPEYYKVYQVGAVGRESPAYTLRDFMRTETLKFFDDVRRQDRSILDLIDGHYTFLNGPLAELYGVVDTKGNSKNQPNPQPDGKPIDGIDFVRVDLQGTRAGLLTQASLLTITSNPGRTSPVKRGKFVLEQFLAQPPPPPPPNVPALEATHNAGGTLRQQMEQHRANPACAACHREMDAIGFSFENFDAIGRFRDQEDNVPIDASGTLPGGAVFTGASGLEKILKDRGNDFTRCFTEQMMTYALGRQVQYFDKPAVDRVVQAAQADGYKFSRLVAEIVKSDPFKLRRGKDQKDE